MLNTIVSGAILSAQKAQQAQNTKNNKQNTKNNNAITLREVIQSIENLESSVEITNLKERASGGRNIDMVEFIKKVKNLQDYTWMIAMNALVNGRLNNVFGQEFAMNFEGITHNYGIDFLIKIRDCYDFRENSDDMCAMLVKKEHL